MDGHEDIVKALLCGNVSQEHVRDAGTKARAVGKEEVAHFLLAESHWSDRGQVVGWRASSDATA